MKTKIKGWLMMDWNHIKPYPHPEHEFKAVTIYTDEEWMDEEGYNGVPVEIIVTQKRHLMRLKREIRLLYGLLAASSSHCARLDW
jgi:hypothetical protein